MTNSKTIAHNLFIVCCIATALATLPFPYSYYILLKLLFFGTLIYYAFKLYPGKINGKIAALIALIILYNPIVLVHLGNKLLWLMVNIATLVFMYVLKNQVKP